ncbi:MAG TPA: dinitrogenase iron-molybdenum cofactor biosynthesis protein [candidate division WOR-3 bacterium]|uniref:Dinitrogenase iron-molybdenum cofactor biosynthesis protein n=1 Tax=candidate division WOR-3 bacterium TaxID=2052148 RepID=A0A7C0VCG9_UNCW3|nr:dinitrogenase iron-molybdenum cofactor biosynthesis protein [candidate division WOR-3 bacterium]
MRIAVSATEADYNVAGVDPRFGRCSFFVIYDTETGEWSSFPNPAKDAVGGAAIKAVEFLKSKNVDVVVTGNLGPNATSSLTAAGIRAITGVTGKVLNAVKRAGE